MAGCLNRRFFCFLQGRYLSGWNLLCIWLRCK
jgi:hypothetical protein